MQLRQLRYFVAVAEELHFGRAARRLHISQPPLSQQIKALENELDVQLLERDRRSVALTEAGKAFLEHANEILRSTEAAAIAARKAAAGEYGVLRVGYSGSALYSTKVLAAMAAFRDRYPAVELELREGTTRTRTEEVARGNVDLGLVRGPLPAFADSLKRRLIARERLLIALPHTHRYADRRTLRIADLDGERLITYPRRLGTALNELVNRLFRENAVVPNVHVEASEMSSILGLVGAGAGVAVVPESVVGLRSSYVTFKPLANRNAVVELYVISRARPTAAASNFVRLLAGRAARS